MSSSQRENRSPEHIGHASTRQERISTPSHTPPSPHDTGPYQGLYLHLPFCFHKCHYCDFFSVAPPTPAPPPPTHNTASNPRSNQAERSGGQTPQDKGTTKKTPGDAQADFTAALLRELEHHAHPPTHHHHPHPHPTAHPLRPRTLFVGGGTPTFLRPELWARLLDALHHHRVLDRVAEFSVEANPETVTPPLMQQLADGGVNRVSIGAQSFNRESLAALERWHDPDNVPRAVDACRAAGISNFSLDLIFAIPGQTLDMLDRDLDRLLELDPAHLSIYGLTYEPQTPLAARLRVGHVTRVDEDTERAMYDRIMTRLDHAGYEQYELSNWAKRDPHSDNRCQHNLAYWHNHNWLGLGPAAASHRDGTRWRNAPNLPRYLQHAPQPPRVDEETLPPNRRAGERLMLALRLNQGITRQQLRQLLPPDDPRHAYIQEVTEMDMIETTDTHTRLTRKGRFVADTILARLL